jgi:hypothetical protein
MTSLADERGGVIAKLLGILLVLAVGASAAVYVYGKHQQPLSADGVHVATSDGERQPATVGLARNRRIYVATIMRNDGRLPVTIDGLAAELAPATQPYVPVAIELGDGRSPRETSGAFVPPALGPGTGVGVVVVYAVNPGLDCGRYGGAPSDPVPFPPVPVRLSSYGVDTTQSVPLGSSAPTVDGITRATCAHATG